MLLDLSKWSFPAKVKERQSSSILNSRISRSIQTSNNSVIYTMNSLPSIFNTYSKSFIISILGHRPPSAMAVSQAQVRTRSK